MPKTITKPCEGIIMETQVLTEDAKEVQEKTKVCFKCCEIKPLSEFYKHKQMGDGHLNKCKECAKKDVSENYRSNIQYYKQYERKRAMLPHRVWARREYQQTEKGRKRLIESHQRYRYNYPQKRAAHVAVGNAIRSGRLKRQPCFICGSKNTQAHHYDYSKPLSVIWLCEEHHLWVHGKRKRAA
jgi:hypothetical protein